MNECSRFIVEGPDQRVPMRVEHKYRWTVCFVDCINISLCIDDNLLSGPDLRERGHLALLFKVSVDLDAGCLFAYFPRLVVHKRMDFETTLHRRSRLSNTVQVRR